MCLCTACQFLSLLNQRVFRGSAAKRPKRGTHTGKLTDWNKTLTDRPSSDAAHIDQALPCTGLRNQTCNQQQLSQRQTSASGQGRSTQRQTPTPVLWHKLVYLCTLSGLPERCASGQPEEVFIALFIFTWTSLTVKVVQFEEIFSRT